jgi:hypothetical protein
MPMLTRSVRATALGPGRRRWQILASVCWLRRTRWSAPVSFRPKSRNQQRGLCLARPRLRWRHRQTPLLARVTPVSALPGITGGWLQSGSSSAPRSWCCAARIARGRAWPPGVPGSMGVRCCRGRQLPQNESSALWPGCRARRKVANWTARFIVGGPLKLDVGPCERRQHGPVRDRWGWQKGSDLNRFPDAPVTGACIRAGRHGVTVQSSCGGAVPSRW